MSIFKKEYVIGLDIGNSSVKLAQFMRGEDGLRLVKTRLQEIVYSANDAAREANAVSALKDITKGIDLRKSKLIVNINCPQTAIKKVTAPYMPKAELKDGIRLTAKSYFHFPIDESLIDFEIIRDIFEKGTRKYELVVAACPVMVLRQVRNGTSRFPSASKGI